MSDAQTPTTPDDPARPDQPRGSALLRAVAVMEALRGPAGDAWTHRQSHASLARYLLEETHEVLEVIDDPDSHGPGALADELGDLLFQILFHARVGQEEDPAWDVDDVARAFVAKMERRNPHVFGAEPQRALADPGDVEEIIAQWHAVKAAERASSGQRDPGWFDSIPAQLPALQTAAKAVHRARSAGRLEELLHAADAAAEAADGAAEQDEEQPAAQDGEQGGQLGRALLDLVVAAEEQDVDPESALRSLLARTRTRLAQASSGTPGAGTATGGTRDGARPGTA